MELFHVQFSGEVPCCLKQSRLPNPQWNLQVQWLSYSWPYEGESNRDTAGGLTFCEADFITPPIQSCYHDKSLQKETIYVFFLVAFCVALIKYFGKCNLREKKIISALLRGTVHHGRKDKTAGSESSWSCDTHSWETESSDWIHSGPQFSFCSLFNPSFPARSNLQKRWVVQSINTIKLICHSHA